MYDGPVTSTNYWPNPDNNAFDNNRITYNRSRLGVPTMPECSCRATT
jgi:hypothetical protein